MLRQGVLPTPAIFVVDKQILQDRANNLSTRTKVAKLRTEMLYSGFQSHASLDILARQAQRVI